MAFNITEFSSKINQHGVAKSNLFSVQITLPPKLAMIENYISTRDLQFFCRSVDLPKVEVNTTSFYAETIGQSERRVTGINDYDVLPMTFMVDSNYNVVKFFHRWMQSVVNYDVSAGKLTELPGSRQMAYEVGYKTDYSSTITIETYSGNSPFGGNYKYVLGNAFPINVGNATHAYDQDGLMIIPVGFTYDILKVDGTTQGVVSQNPFNRVNNLVDNLQTAATLADITGATGVSNGIQNFINTLTTIGTIDNFLG